jgi:hypothetical protein
MLRGPDPRLVPPPGSPARGPGPHRPHDPVLAPREIAHLPVRLGPGGSAGCCARWSIARSQASTEGGNVSRTAAATRGSSACCGLGYPRLLSARRSDTHLRVGEVRAAVDHLDRVDPACRGEEPDVAAVNSSSHCKPLPKLRSQLKAKAHTPSNRNPLHNVPRYLFLPPVVKPGRSRLGVPRLMWPSQLCGRHAVDAGDSALSRSGTPPNSCLADSGRPATAAARVPGGDQRGYGVDRQITVNSWADR